jgi:flagella basal body P-ring formation protein FlgA
MKMDASPSQLLSSAARTLGWSLLLGVCLGPLGTLAQQVERASAALAQAPNTSRSTSAPSGAGIGSTIEAFLTAQTRQLEGQVEFDVGAPDPSISLAPCNVVEPFLPSGTRLWGKTRLGLRCTEGARWSITVPLNVRVIGRAWVAARTLTPGQPVSESDLTEAEVELTNEPGAPLRPGSNLEFRALTRTVAPGTVIREDWLRALPVVVQGEIVKMTIRGNGFAISADGVALNNAVDGAQVRIRTENGRTVSGTARPGKVAEIRL